MVPRQEPQLQPPPPIPPRRTPSTNSTKRSFSSYQSHSSSFEADDERSSTADDEMGPDDGLRDDPSTYAGEDTRLTSRKELSGWYAYGFAAEVFVICGMGEFFDVLQTWGTAAVLRRVRHCGQLGSRPSTRGVIRDIHIALEIMIFSTAAQNRSPSAVWMMWYSMFWKDLY